MSQFLTPDEVVALTGRKHARLQIANLRQNGIPFTINASGRPVVNRDNLNGDRQKKQPAPTAVWQPKALEAV